MLIKNWHNFYFKAKLVTNRSNAKKRAILTKISFEPKLYKAANYVWVFSYILCVMLRITYKKEIYCAILYIIFAKNININAQNFFAINMIETKN